jgi:hypothetical protein
MAYGNVYPSQKFIPYCLPSFQTCKQYKSLHYKHPKNIIYIYIYICHLGWTNIRSIQNEMGYFSLVRWHMGGVGLDIAFKCHMVLVLV